MANKGLRTSIVILFVAVILLPASAFAQASLGNGLKPHKALYKIKMTSKKSGTQILNISGEMFYEWKPDCDAWITDHRFNLFYEYADNPAVAITTDFSTYETFDGKNFEFSALRKRDGEIFEELRGNATMSDDGGTVTFKTPEGLNFPLSKGTAFPMMHTLKMLEKAQNGSSFYTQTIFDGSDSEGPILVNSFIGKPINAMAVIKPSKNLDANLYNTPARKVRMAFFPLNTEDPSSEYEIDLIFHENGIISDMLVEYHDFTVSQKLIALESIAEPSCEAE